MLWCRWILPFNFGSPIKSRARFRIPPRELSSVQQRPTMEEEQFELTVWCYHGKLWWCGDLRIGGLLLALPAERNTWSWHRPLQRWRTSGSPTATKSNGENKERICKIFRKCDLKITIEANKKVVNFLDVTLDLNTEKFKPYSKPSSTPLYVHSKSNHPPNIIKNIPESVNRRLSEISSDEAVFNEAATPYQDALYKSGYTYKLEFKPPQRAPSQRRNRSQKIIWYNPPYDKNVKSRIGREFLRLTDECFPAGHKLRRIFNRNTLKLSYSCMQNVQQIIKGHNQTVLKNSAQPIQDQARRTCNCRKKEECPLEGNCLA